MAKYFKYFPKTQYNLNDRSISVQEVTNLLTRVKFENEFKDNTSIYYEYEIVDGDTPEIIASKIYKDVEKHWVVLMLNEIINPFNDWPMRQNSLTNYIEKKYLPFATDPQTGLEWAQVNYKEYYKVQTTSLKLTGEKSIYKISIDANTYASFSSTSDEYTLNDGTEVIVTTVKDALTYYDYEVQENENRRKIKLLKPEFVSVVEQELMLALQ
jgi:hypothetical protein